MMTRTNTVRRGGHPAYKRCAFTGYRPQKLPWGMDERDPRCLRFKARLRETLEELIGRGYAHFLSGGAQGMDLYAAELVLELRKKYPWILLEMVSPYDAQAALWTEENRQRHERLFASADVVTATGHEYSRACILRRNKYLVDNADLLLAAYDGKPGGTAMTLDYAKRTGVPCRILPPEARGGEEI